MSKPRSRRGRFSLWSRDSFLSIASVGSVLSIGSIGSAGSVFSIGSVLSIGSGMSSLSAWSLMSNRSFGGVQDDGARDLDTPPAASAPVLVALVATAALGSWALARVITRGRRSSDGPAPKRTQPLS